MKDLASKVAVVTGGASGIGLAMAERFARAGMKIVLADIEDEALRKAENRLEQAGAAVLSVRTDVSVAADVDALRERALARFGAVHVLCNNAGVGVGGLSWEVPLAEWDWVIGVNLYGVIHGVRSFVPSMLAQGEGHIVNTASVAGLISVATLAPYGVTKHAVVTMSESLHHELAIMGGKVGVSVLCPGFVKTAIGSSHRNRPEAIAAVKAAPSQEGFAAMLDHAIANGIDPSVVAEAVHDAIVARRFYVFTHPKLKGAFARRSKEILDESAPTFDPSQI